MHSVSIPFFARTILVACDRIARAFAFSYNFTRCSTSKSYRRNPHVSARASDDRRRRSTSRKMFAVRISPRIANSLDMSKVGVGVSAVEHPAGAEPDLSPNVEMYLKVIVRLYGGDGPVSTSAVARELAVSAPSASVMLKRLDADGFVTHEGRQGVIPTPLGSRVGAITLRRQLLAERLLVDRLGISWEVATGEACRLEHAISPLVEQQLAAFLESRVPARTGIRSRTPTAGSGATTTRSRSPTLISMPKRRSSRCRTTCRSCFASWPKRRSVPAQT